MSEWKTVKLGDVCEIIMGQSPSGNSYNSKSEGMPFFQGKAEFGVRYPTVKKWTTEPSKISIEKDILMSVRAPVGATNINNMECCIGRGLCAIRADKKKIDYLYLYHFLNKNEKTIENLGVGSTFKAINRKQLDQFEIPLPPLPIQKQIVSILEKAENIKKKRNETNKETQKIIQSLFYEMFGDPVKNETGWDVKTISEIGEVISGSTPKTTSKEYWNGEVNWVTPAELIDGDNYYYYETERKISQAGLKSIGNRLFPVGTVMLTTRAPIGKVAIAGNEMCSNQGLKNIICNDKLVHPVYLYVWLLTRKDYLNSIGTGATFKEISKKTVETVSLSVPPLPLQEEFAKKVQLIESIQSKQQFSTEEINTLFDALMQKAFKGDLVE